MQSKILLALVLSALQVSAAPAELSANKRQACAPVHLIIARASTESPGEGIIGTVADYVVAASSQTITRESINYPALLSPYDESSQAGTAAVKQQLTAYVTRCPNSKVVLLGYSQGAHIIGDALCGGGGLLIGAKTSPVSSAISSKVVAVVQMGDPRHIRGESYHVGTALRDGLFPRTSDQSCEGFASKFKSYCDLGDTFCASGLSTVTHLAYVTVYGLAARNFVVSKIGG